MVKSMGCEIGSALFILIREVRIIGRKYRSYQRKNPLTFGTKNKENGRMDLYNIWDC